jgi:GNAT superfamily N-acetyltransferase
VTQLTHAIDRRPYGRWHARDAIIRPIRASDKRLPERGMRRLSPESARLRFLGPKDHLTLAELRYLTEIDYVDHYAVVAVAADDPRELLGVGRWVRDPARPFAAELAIAVGDCYQGRGLGTALGEALVEAARTRGIEEFTASILPENLPAQRLFARLSDRMSTHVEHGIYEVVARLSA